MTDLSDRKAGAVLAGFALFAFALHLATIGLYGYHRDELYLLACGRHLEWGSVDHAPITPALSRFAALVLGESAYAQRIVAALAGALVVWLTGLITRRLGGNLPAQLLAMASVLIAPVFIFVSGVYGTNAVEHLACALAVYLALLALDGSRFAWLALGLVLGIGLLDKYTVLVFGLALAAGVVATQARAHLKTPWPYAGAALAILLCLPTIRWQYAHGAPAIDFMRDHYAVRLRTVSLAAFFYQQPVILNPLSFAVAMVGLVASLRGRAHSRIFGVMFLVAAAVFIASQGKPYYLAPFYPALIAIGAVVCERHIGSWRLAAATWVVGGAIAFVCTVPVLPSATAHGLGLYRVNEEFVQFADWHDIVSQIASAYREVGAQGVLTDSYGTAAALDRYGPELRLPPAISGANGYYWWGPPSDPESVIAIGYAPELLATIYRDVSPIGQIRGQFDLDN
ncbi:MAG: ArnT family glycosyltransferase, partial [Myxococcales bacterium]